MKTLRFVFMRGRDADKERKTFLEWLERSNVEWEWENEPTHHLYTVITDSRAIELEARTHFKKHIL